MKKSLNVQPTTIIRMVVWPQLSLKITGIKKIFKTWDLYQSMLYTLEDYFLKKIKFFNTGFFSTDRLVVLPYKAKCHLRGKISKGSTFLSDRIL